MPQQPTPNQKPRKKRRWLRRIGWSFLGLLVLLVAFHRPIVHYGGRWLAIYLAKKQNIELDLRIEGNVWNHLEIHNIRAKRMGAGPAAIEHLTLDRVAADYDLLQLIRGNL